jgi:parallel beta-helix repeat protein
MDTRSHRTGATCLAMLGLVAIIGGTVSSAATLIVPRDFATIQQAADTAEARDTIALLSGVYSERVVISVSEVTLKSRSRNDPAVIDGSGIGGEGVGVHVLGTPADPVSGVTVQGLVVQNFERGIVLEHAVFSTVRDSEAAFNEDKGPLGTPDNTQADGIVLIASGSNRILNNLAHHNGHDGIFARDGSSNNDIKNNVTVDNGTQFPSNPAPPKGCGIQIGLGTNLGNNVANNTVNGNGWGIQLGPMGVNNGNRLQRNLVYDNLRAGIAILAGSENLAVRNDASGNHLESAWRPSLDCDLWDTAPLDNDWRRNEGLANFDGDCGTP